MSRGKRSTFLSTRYLSFPQNVARRFSWIGPIWPFVKAQRLFSNAQWTCQLHVWRIRPSNGTNWIHWSPSKSCCLRIRASNFSLLILFSCKLYQKPFYCYVSAKNRFAALSQLFRYMTDILREDEGWFICQASNSQGENEARVYLDVLEVPGFKRLDTKVPGKIIPVSQCWKMAKKCLILHEN